jgi:hypothetical protein
MKYWKTLPRSSLPAEHRVVSRRSWLTQRSRQNSVAKLHQLSLSLSPLLGGSTSEPAEFRRR